MEADGPPTTTSRPAQESRCQRSTAPSPSALLVKVWESISDFRTTEQWDPPTVKTTRESGDGVAGTVYNNTSKILGLDVDIVYTVTEH